ncbi:DEAD/DEAH box helicase [uncultured Psychrobacter sp.]|uniref:DEAD/DEAH box helicase n=1 Tax=uncultured Psychrobacter sp. TaxID=259303 RepID=UPI00262E1EAF|nr:DEAD/DEAH box helicase [uncultured Psychrobacter sp.]
MSEAMTDDLIPVPGCLVKYRLNDSHRFGRVRGNINNEVLVNWQGNTQTTVDPKAPELSSGFKVGHVVLDRTPDIGHQPLGQGTVIQQRVLAGFEQLLVDFKSINRKVWMPYQHLVLAKDAKTRYRFGDISRSDTDAEKLRLKTLAHAIELWNENTGSLSHLDIDPLPHQINLVHHILSSGNLNWLIADDVGLGKTIETGMIIHALRQRNVAKRILLITPAGLVRQWQEELYHKFNLDGFEIYGEDFKVTSDQLRKWKLHDCVIGSIDRLKSENHIDILLAAEPWDLIIFDEGHRLSRKQDGLKFKASERFTLAKKLRHKTKSMILLSATPHQGEQDKFIALLELLRPERRAQLMSLSINPEIIRDMVFRNHKADVTDLEGNFIFQGKTVNAVSVPGSPAFKTFEKQLAEYFKLGYSASTEGENQQARAIGFVMTTYRKLAASSVKAIRAALLRRIAKIENRRDELHAIMDSLMELEADERFSGENEELLITTHNPDREFFDGELALLQELVISSNELLNNDKKFDYFKSEVIDKILANNAKEKVLIFSEYRNTQDYIKDNLVRVFGDSSVSLINGSMTHDERRKAIEHFESEGSFLISTEAGGEGINLQRACHIMVNYDLPWNPMRLVQRIGRLYRYGQKKRVAIFNLFQPDSLDQKLIVSMYDRIDQIVNDLSTLHKGEFNEGLKDEILGEVANQIDVEDVLSNLNKLGISRTEQRVSEALDNAKSSVIKQREILDYAATSSSDELQFEVTVSPNHIHNFLIGMLEINGIEYINHPEKKTIRIKFNDDYQAKFKSILGQASILEATTDRVVASNRSSTHLLDLSSPITQYFIGQATDYDFGGLSAVVNSAQSTDHTEINTSIMKWQDLQGNIIKKQLCICCRSEDGVRVNPKGALDVFLQKSLAVDPSLPSPNREHCKQVVAEIDLELSEYMAINSNRYLMPSDINWVNIATVT